MVSFSFSESAKGHHVSQATSHLLPLKNFHSASIKHYRNVFLPLLHLHIAHKIMHTILTKLRFPYEISLFFFIFPFPRV